MIYFIYSNWNRHYFKQVRVLKQALNEGYETNPRPLGFDFLSYGPKAPQTTWVKKRKKKGFILPPNEKKLASNQTHAVVVPCVVSCEKMSINPN